MQYLGLGLIAIGVVSLIRTLKEKEPGESGWETAYFVIAGVGMILTGLFLLLLPE